MSEADGVEGGVFVHRARVYWDELDALQMLHNARLVVHLERARIAWYESLDQPWALDARDNPDQVHVVRELRLEYLAPVRGTRTMRVEVWVERMGTTSCVYGFRFVDPDGDVLARGTQAIVKLDLESGRPAPWTAGFRDAPPSPLRTARRGIASPSNPRTPEADMNRTILTATIASLLAAPAGLAQEPPDSIVVEMVDLDGEPVGVAILVDGPAGVLVRADLRGLSAGEHAFHVHETGACEPPFESAGGHLRVEGTSHGILSARGMHAGDLPNFHVPATGEARFDAFAPGVRFREGGLTLRDEDGSALVVHRLPDDYRSDPAGDAGPRIACGRIAG